MNPTQDWRKDFEDCFGAVFSFPPTVQSATGYKHDPTYGPQAYEGRYDTKTIESFIESLIEREAQVCIGCKQQSEEFMAAAEERGRLQGIEEAVKHIKATLVPLAHEMDYGGYVFAVATDDIEEALATTLDKLKGEDMTEVMKKVDAQVGRAVRRL